MPKQDMTVENAMSQACSGVRAARHGRSMEEEAREILRSVLDAPRSPDLNLVQAIRRRFAVFGGVELELPRREAMRQAPDLAK